MTEPHPLFLRLMRRCGLSADDVASDPRWAELARRISRTYVENDEDRYLRERSLDISSREMQELNAALAEERRRLQGELVVAQNLQVSILPRDLRTARFEVAARMIPATEVGGDYYDVIPVEDGCWIGIGDVAGHGLRAAVIMTMVQSMTAALIRHIPTIAPREVMVTLNRGVRENVFSRMRFDNHVTMTLFRCAHDGTVTFAGAHEAILVLRGDVCEEVDTPGTWLGPVDDIASATTDSALRLDAGDVMVLYTDGVLEARNAAREEYGLDRLKSRILALRSEPVAVICDAVIASVRDHQATADDDITVLAYRRL